jgi:hypothetical protein
MGVDNQYTDEDCREDANQGKMASVASFFSEIRLFGTRQA